MNVLRALSSLFLNSSSDKRVVKLKLSIALLDSSPFLSPEIFDTSTVPVSLNFLTISSIFPEAVSSNAPCRTETKSFDLFNFLDSFCNPKPFSKFAASKSNIFCCWRLDVCSIKKLNWFLKASLIFLETAAKPSLMNWEDFSKLSLPKFFSKSRFSICIAVLARDCSIAWEYWNSFWRSPSCLCAISFRTLAASIAVLYFPLAKPLIISSKLLTINFPYSPLSFATSLSWTAKASASIPVTLYFLSKSDNSPWLKIKSENWDLNSVANSPKFLPSWSCTFSKSAKSWLFWVTIFLKLASPAAPVLDITSSIAT